MDSLGKWGRTRLLFLHLLLATLEVDDEEDDAHEHADGADGDVGDAEEGVLAPQDRGRREDHALRTAERGHPEAWRGRFYRETPQMISHI